MMSGSVRTPFGLSLSKALLSLARSGGEVEGFDKLSPNGVWATAGAP
jgi:hypothetical protein